MTRSERQEIAVQKWVDAKLKGTLELPTAFGKTRCGLMAIKRFQDKYPTHKVLIVVPNEPIKAQWLQELANWRLKADVVTMGVASKEKLECTFLVIDEEHKLGAPTLSKIFDNVRYRIILGLTATFERLDGKHQLIAARAPIVDKVTLKEAIDNKWLNSYVEYKVLLEVDDLATYQKIDREFHEHFAFFDYNFQLAMSCASDWAARVNEAKRRVQSNDPEKWQPIHKQLIVHAAGFSRTLQARKKFIYEHPKKVEIANMILSYRMDKKAITFSNTISMAEKLSFGKVYSGKDTKKKGRMTLEEFKKLDVGVLHTIAKLDEGYNDPKINLGIIVGFNSSKTKSMQRLGRILRVSETGETKELFTLVLKGTQDEIWSEKSLSGRDYITIDEEGLMNLLQGKEFTPKVDRASHIMFTA